VIEDFALSNLARTRFLADRVAQGRPIPEWSGFARAPADAMRMFLDGIDERYGSVRGYARDELGLSADVLDALKARLLNYESTVDVSELLLDGYGRLPALVRSAVDGLTADQLRWAPGAGSNPIGWLVWHLTRVQDHHVSELLDADQVWVTGGFAARFGLEPDPHHTRYGRRPKP